MLDRTHLRNNLPTCEANQCDHYGPDPIGRVGCLLRKGCPCDIGGDLLKGHGCYLPQPIFSPTPEYITKHGPASDEERNRVEAKMKEISNRRSKP